MNNNRISIASLVIGLGTVVVVNYIFPVIDTALTAICTKLNVDIVKNQAEIKTIAQESGLDEEEKLYSPGAKAESAPPKMSTRPLADRVSRPRRLPWNPRRRPRGTDVLLLPRR